MSAGHSSSGQCCSYYTQLFRFRQAFNFFPRRLKPQKEAQRIRPPLHFRVLHPDLRKE